MWLLILLIAIIVATKYLYLIDAALSEDDDA